MFTLAFNAALIIAGLMLLSLMTGGLCAWFDDSPLLVQALACAGPAFCAWIIFHDTSVPLLMTCAHAAGFATVYLGKRI